MARFLQGLEARGALINSEEPSLRSRTGRNTARVVPRSPKGLVDMPLHHRDGPDRLNQRPYAVEGHARALVLVREEAGHPGRIVRQQDDAGPGGQPPAFVLDARAILGQVFLPRQIIEPVAMPPDPGDHETGPGWQHLPPSDLAGSLEEPACVLVVVVTAHREDGLAARSDPLPRLYREAPREEQGIPRWPSVEVAGEKPARLLFFEDRLHVVVVERVPGPRGSVHHHRHQTEGHVQDHPAWADAAGNLLRDRLVPVLLELNRM